MLSLFFTIGLQLVKALCLYIIWIPILPLQDDTYYGFLPPSSYQPNPAGPDKKNSPRPSRPAAPRVLGDLSSGAPPLGQTPPRCPSSCRFLPYPHSLAWIGTARASQSGEAVTPLPHSLEKSVEFVCAREMPPPAAMLLAANLGSAQRWRVLSSRVSTRTAGYDVWSAVVKHFMSPSLSPSGTTPTLPVRMYCNLLRLFTGFQRFASWIWVWTGHPFCKY
jgi:hypothetical protein